MRATPAPAVATTPASRVVDLQYNYDWLANMNEWADDTSSFYERSIGDSRSGYGDVESSLAARPGALYFSANLPASAPGYSAAADRGGYLELTYGEGGDVTTMTVHAQCRDVSAVATCWAPSTPAGSDTGGVGWAARRTQARAGCSCQAEQHYQYRWDEVNRLAEARRYDRTAGTGTYSIKFRQRYRYDGSNVRTVKQTIDSNPGTDPAERVAVYVFAGDYERRGLRVDTVNDKYIADASLDTETQYLVGGARVVWQKTTYGAGVDREVRVTMPLSDVIATTGAVLDLRTGALLEYSTYYPNGARETFRTEGSVAPEPSGFTGKEGDEEVGLTYFGERYLISRVGRWTIPDPLEVHALDGGEVGNGYHYVSGSLLAARDPLGLRVVFVGGEFRPRTGSAQPLTVPQDLATRVGYRDFLNQVDPNERDLYELRGNELFLSAKGKALYHSGGGSEAFRMWGGVIWSQTTLEIAPLVRPGRDSGLLDNASNLVFRDAAGNTSTAAIGGDPRPGHEREATAGHTMTSLDRRGPCAILGCRNLSGGTIPPEHVPLVRGRTDTVRVSYIAEASGSTDGRALAYAAMVIRHEVRQHAAPAFRGLPYLGHRGISNEDAYWDGTLTPEDFQVLRDIMGRGVTTDTPETTIRGRRRRR